MHVAVIGATGGTGRELVELALAAGHDVRALARDPLAVKRVHPRLVVVPGDALHGPGLADVMDGADVVLSCLGNKSLKQTIVGPGTRRIMEAAAGSGVKRAVIMSSVGVGDSVAQAKRMSLVLGYLLRPLLFSRVFADLLEAERAAFSSGLSVVVVRPSRLTDDDAIGKIVTVGPDGDVPAAIARKDVARFMLSLLDDTRWDGRAVSIGGK